ncbi:MAG: hypothetical protein AB1499_01995 [Nitrospirota bacterium]
MHLSGSAVHFMIPVAGLTVNVLTQLLSVRLISGLGILKSVFTGFVIGGLGVLFAEIYISGGHQGHGPEALSMIAANVIIYGALGYCYFHFINLGITARRIRILRELYMSGRGLTLDELLKRYNAGDMISKRLDRLLGSGQIVCVNDKYHIGKPVMLMMSRTIVVMKLIILGKKSEFD